MFAISTLGQARRQLTILALALLAFTLPAASDLAGQDGSPRALTVADYASWRTMSGASISDDGAWVSWSYQRVRGDDTLHVAAVGSDAHHTVALASGAEISSDGNWAAYYLELPYLEIEKLERDDDPVTRQAGLLNLNTGETLTWDDADEFGFSETSSHFFVKKGQADDKAEHDGTDLILRNLAEGFEELIGSVDEAEFNKAGTHLAFTVDAADKDGNGVYLINLATGARRGLDNAKERYARLTWSEEGKALAVLRGDKPDKKVERENTLLAFADVLGNRAAPVAFSSTDGAPDGWVLSEKGSLVWNEDGTSLFVATKEQDDELEDWPEEDVPLADVNIWHWQDDRIQAQQQQSASRDRDRTYVAAANLATKSIVPLADEEMPQVQVTRDGRWGIGANDRAYISDWKPDFADYYRIDTHTGERTLFLEAQLNTLGLSPDSQHFLYWKDGHIWDYSIDRNEHHNLTASAPVDFTDQEFDRFGERPPYGVAGWTEDGMGVVLYDRYDMWLQPLDGTSATNITGGKGTADEIRLRYVRTDREARTIDLKKPILIEGYGEWTKKEGFFELDGEDLKELTWEDAQLRLSAKAEDADRYLFTVQTFRDFPDLWITDGDFADRERVTTANPQQADFAWGHRILFDYTDSDGVPLQGTLAIPDNYEQGQKLPMIVRFYEQYSQDLHLYPTPTYRHSPMFADYVSNGYLVMQPDIHFRVGSSHSDMLESVEAAVQKVIDMGYADPAAVGLSGHSYSGGGGAYIATRSTMFAAVAHGAAPINLVSEFNQLFVGSGQNNHSYDIYGQGRYATNPYDDFDTYWEQSPISGVETMDTPVLYLHGEADPTVNWEQGLEWYNALRFLGKPIIWLSYPDEGHGLRKLQNRVDFQYRLNDFFGHHLKGEPAPTWMTDGVDFLDKERAMREYTPQIFKPRVIS